ncbi:MAG: (2Fe-2S)-binding protein [Burkholderiales bacterium]|nr:MAG: (2Fe-2S)-binding protein [Burkholderiales bacterium]
MRRRWRCSVKRASTFVRLLDEGAAVSFEFEGRTIEARDGDTIAAALLANGIDRFRSTAVGNAPRGPFCLMGSCFDCLVEVDAQSNVQACMTRVEAGMKVRRQAGLGELA